MKAALYNSSGEKKGSVDLPEIFSSSIREDIVAKYFEASKFKQPYTPKFGAGLRQQGFGQVSHKRHDWKGHYGKGVSRVPRKTMSRRGTQFFWVASNMPGARGGRRAHPPKGIGRERKVNKNEMKIALHTGFAATSHLDLIKKRYETLRSIEHAPFVIDHIPEKTKSFISFLRKVFGENLNLALKVKTVRAGKGKSRGRKYKSNAGILIVKSSQEKVKLKGFDVRTPKEVMVSDLYPLGRLALYTEKALHELSSKENKI